MSSKRLLTAALLLPFAAACKGDSTGGPPVGDVRLSQTRAWVAVGDTLRVTATAVTPEGTAIANPRFTWRSTNEGVATVSSTGTVTGRAPGDAQIIATLRNVADTLNVTVLQAAALRSFNVNADEACANPTTIQARRVATTANVEFYHDLRNPEGGLTDADYQQLANRFQSEMWPVVTGNFGTPPDIDGNGRVVVLYTRAVNELTPPSSNFVIGGFFWVRDLFPRVATARLGACPASNEAEMFYMLAADPAGEVNNNRRSADVIRRQFATLAHELQHLINAGRRLHVLNSGNFETVWLDEGLSHIAEELVFYSTSGTSPRQNISLATLQQSEQVLNAFNQYSIQNFGRLQSWMQNPSGRTPIGTEDDLATRGAAWAFLRYAADRRNGNDQQLWNGLVNTTATGLANVAAQFGQADPLPWFQDWGVAMYTSDAVPNVPARFTNPSWNFRNIYMNAAFGSAYPLQVQTLAAGQPLNVSVRAASSAYVRFGVPAGGTADIRTTAAGTTHAGACTPLDLTVGQVHQVAAAALPAFCVTGGGAGADYVVVPFHYSTTGSATVEFTITGTGITAPLGPPSPDRAAAGPRLSRGPELVQDLGFEQRLREREREELEPLIRGGMRGPARQMDVAPGSVRLSIVRTR